MAARGGAAAFSPTDVAGLSAWYDANVGALTDVDGVYQWNDQSGSGNNLTQSTGSKKPQLVTGRLNGLSGIYFDGTDDWMECLSGNWSPGVSTTVGNGFSLFMVFEQVRDTVVERIWQGDGASNKYGAYVNTTGDRYTFGSNQSFHTATNSAAPGIYVASFRAEDNSAVINIGGTTASGDGGDSSWDGIVLCAGGGVARPVPGQFYMHEVIWYDNTSAYDSYKTDIESYFNTRWGL